MSTAYDRGDGGGEDGGEVWIGGDSGRGGTDCISRRGLLARL